MWRWLVVLPTLAACAGHSPSSAASSYAATGLAVLDVDGAVGAWAPAPTPALVPVGRWLRVDGVLAYAYIDPEQGLSVRWDSGAPGSPGSVHIRRVLWAPVGMQVLDDAEATSLGLSKPDWVDGYGPQPVPGTPFGAWREVPGLAHRFHPDFPDDLRAVIGEQVGTQFVYELVWLRLLDCVALRCEAALLNQPSNLPAIRQGDRLWFDATGADASRPLAAVPIGRVVPPELASAAATAPELAGMLQDMNAWTFDETGPVAERLVPTGA